MSDALDDFAKKARDHARVPMQVSSNSARIAAGRTDGLISGTRPRTPASPPESLGCASMRITKRGTLKTKWRVMRAFALSGRISSEFGRATTHWYSRPHIHCASWFADPTLTFRSMVNLKTLQKVTKSSLHSRVRLEMSGISSD